MAVPRAYQVDAVDLDSECLELFRGQFRQATAHLPGGFWEKIEPEITALLDVAVHVVPIVASSALVGQQLLGMQFSGANSVHIPKKWYLYGLAVVFSRWFSERWKILSTLILSESNLPMAERAMDSLQTFLKISSFLNSLIFLKDGTYPTLIHRILKLRTRLIQPDEPRSADVSILTRELLWHSFADLLMFTLPLVNIHRLKRWLTSWKAQTEQEGSIITFELNEKCAACNEPPIIPQKSECRHIFCYYCVKANLAADPHYCCPLCGNAVL